MTRILVTAFEPYGEWNRNSSWDALVAWLSSRGGLPGIVTRKYPVDLIQLQSRLERDLAQGVDAVLHFGQAPGIAAVQLESIALNIAGVTETPGRDYGPILQGAPLAYRTNFPVGRWAMDIKHAGIPSTVSYHAGTYLCNAAMFLSHHWFASRGEAAHVGFVHLPLSPEQVLDRGYPLASLPIDQSARAVGILVDRVVQFCEQSPNSSPASHIPTQTA
jgi:pyroglutamyl-peptidase